MTLYFVVRTDVSSDSGSQRVFGAYDTEAEAAAQASRLRGQILGRFAVYKGSPT